MVTKEVIFLYSFDAPRGDWIALKYIEEEDDGMFYHYEQIIYVSKKRAANIPGSTRNLNKIYGWQSTQTPAELARAFPRKYKIITKEELELAKFADELGGYKNDEDTEREFITG